MNNSDSFAAAGKACRDFALELEKAGHEVFVFAPRFKCGVEREESTWGNVTIRRFSWRGSGKRLSMLKPNRPRDLAEILRFVYFGSRECMDFCRENKIDHIMAMWAVPAGAFALLIKKSLKIPFSVWALGADIWVYGRKPLLKNLVRQVLNGADHRFADGLELCKEVEELGSKKCHFLPHLSYIDLSGGSSISLVRRGGKKHFLFIGRWEEPKGPDILMDAITLLIQEEKNVEFHLIGGGPLDSILNEKIKENSLENFVNLLGWVDQDTLVGYLKSCDALVIPSRIESIPCVYSEAMSAGIPVIATNVGDMGILTQKFEVGRVAEPENPQSLCLEMKSFLSDDVGFYKENTHKVAKEWELSSTVSTYLSYLK